jgi:ribosomal-protein-alanine N-acetyltransferase
MGSGAWPCATNSMSADSGNRRLARAQDVLPGERTSGGHAASNSVARLRRATLGDIARVVEIERDSFSDPWSAAAFRAALAEDRMLFLVAEGTSGELVGYVVAWATVDEAELANLAVTRAARGEGIGKALVDAALRFGEERGCVCMYLEVRESNAAARSVYAARGFEQVGQRRRYYREPVEDALVLRASLPVRAAEGKES